MTTTEHAPAPVEDEEDPRAIRLDRFKITLVGTRPLIMHNERLADPLDTFTRAIKLLTAKGAKMTDADLEEKARLEFHGGLYLDPEGGPYVPGWNLKRSLVDGARITRSGAKIERGIDIDDYPLPVLMYDGPRNVDKMWRDGRFRYSTLVGVSGRRIVRTRPRFDKWMVQAEGTYDPTVVSLESLAQIAETAGLLTGLGDFRKRFGRFTATVEAIEATS